MAHAAAGTRPRGLPRSTQWIFVGGSSHPSRTSMRADRPGLLTAGAERGMARPLQLVPLRRCEVRWLGLSVAGLPPFVPVLGCRQQSQNKHRGNVMHEVSRRAHLQGLLGMAALAGMPNAARAEDPPVPPERIVHRIKHVSYSDIGGRPDSVQIMSNRNHLYVGHMFSDGVTILDAGDPRDLKPVNFFTAGQYTRTHHLQTS